MGKKMGGGSGGGRESVSVGFAGGAVGQWAVSWWAGGLLASS